MARESNLRKGEALWPSADPARPNLLEGAEGEGLLLRLDRDGASSASRRARSRRQWAGVANGTSTADGCTSGGSFVHSDSSKFHQCLEQQLPFAPPHALPPLRCHCVVQVSPQLTQCLNWNTMTPPTARGPPLPPSHHRRPHRGE